MNEKIFKIFMKAYNEFRTNLFGNINNTNKLLFTKNSEDCYLIEENWINYYINCFDQYNKNNRSLESIISFQKYKPNFINDFKTIITYLKNEKKLKLINKNLLELLFSENDLINIPIKYYGGNDKIIIEYKDKKDAKALLLINPLNQNSIINRVYILSINNKQKLLLYIDLLSEENNLNIKLKKKYQKFVISFENYLNKLNNNNTPQKNNNIINNNSNINYNNNNQINNPNNNQSLNNKNYNNNQNNNIIQSNKNQNLDNNNTQNNINESFKIEVLKILIYIFYYKKYLIEEKENVFNENDDYYIINEEWFFKYLEYYDYQKLYISFLNSKNNPKINYNNLKNYCKSLINHFLKKNLINLGKEKSQDLSNIQNIFAKWRIEKNNLPFNNCYIIPSNIFALIIKNEFPNKIFSYFKKKLYVKDNRIYFIDLFKIIIGCLHKDIFIPKYILSYNSSEILDSEKDIVFSYKLEDYIKLRKCYINNNKTQKLISQEMKIGFLISLNNSNLINEINPLNNSSIKNNNSQITSNNKEKKNNDKVVRKSINKYKNKNIIQFDINNSNEKKNNINYDKNIQIKNQSNNQIENVDNNINQTFNKSQLRNLSSQKKKKMPPKKIFIDSTKKPSDSPVKIKELKENNFLKINEIIKKKDYKILINNKLRNYSLDRENMNKIKKSNENDNKSISNKFEKLAEEYANIKNILENKNNELNETKIKLEKLIKENAELKKIKEEKEEIKQKGNKEKMNFEDLFGEKENEINNLNLKIKNIEEENLKNINDLNVQNNNKLKEKENFIQNLNNDFIKVKNELNILKEQYNSNKNELIDKEDKLNKNEIEKKELILNNKKNEKKIEELNIKNKCIENELILLKEKVNDLQKKDILYEDLLEKNKILEETNKTLKEKNKIIETKYKSLEEINKTLEEKNKNLKEKIDKILYDNNSFKSELSKIEFSLKSEEIKNKDLNNELFKIKGELENKEKQLEEQKKINNKQNNDFMKIINDKENRYKTIQISSNLNKKEKNNVKQENLDIQYQIKEKDLQKKLDFINKEKESNEKRINEILNKENEINQKISFLEDKEVLLEKEKIEIEKKRIEFKKDFDENEKIKKINEAIKQDNESLKQENNYLFNKKKKLKEEIRLKQIQFDQLSSNIGNINKQNNLLEQQHSYNLYNQNQSIQDKGISRVYPSTTPEPSPIETYNKPTLIGLNNIGATCFMNATLECLSQTEGLTNYFLKEKNKDKILKNNIVISNKNDNQLSPVYLDLIKHLWKKNSREKSFSPDNFMKIIEKMNPLFKQGQAGDSKDFIIFILEQFHKELKRQIHNNTPNSNENTQNIKQYDQKSTLLAFFEDFKQDCSIISDLFFGITETTNICLNCKNNFSSKNMDYPICYNYQKFNNIIFPLEEVKKWKYNNFMNINYNNQIYQMYQNNRVSIIDCFSYYQKTDHFTGMNQNYCNICNQTCDSLYTCKIYSSPIFLVLILNRGKGKEFNVKLDFTEIIDISDYVVAKDQKRMIYSLYGVITHIGQSGPSAHFIAFCRSPVDKNWYKYNDAIVSSINNFQNEVIDFGTPYILFYQKQIDK